MRASFEDSTACTCMRRQGMACARMDSYANRTLWDSPATTREKWGHPLDTGGDSSYDNRERYFTYEWMARHDGESSMQGKQAKIVSPAQEKAILGSVATTRYPARDRVMFLLSMKAGLRAKEIASLTWAMVTDAQGQVAEALQLQN